MELAASRHGQPEYVIGQSRSLPQSQLAQVPRGFCDRLDVQPAWLSLRLLIARRGEGAAAVNRDD